jgi:hypothetical protein
MRRDAMHIVSYIVCVSAEVAFFHPLSSYKSSGLKEYISDSVS